MKILIGYDGSKDAEAAIDDLPACGLPKHGTVTVISIAEVWLPPADALENDVADGADKYLEEVVRESRERAERAVAEAEMLARFGANRVKVALPGWTVTSLASYGSPGWEIVSAAEKMKADLIIVGAHGYSFLNRMVLGSISQRVLTEAHCSVRIGRGRIDLDAGPQRVVVGFDGSRGANAAVAAVAAREWSKGTEIRLVAVTEPVTPTSIGRFITPAAETVAAINDTERAWLEHSAKAAIETLNRCRLDTCFVVTSGCPKFVLIEQAERFGADCIFVGANAWGSRLERFLVGSTSAAVASRAHCSVEVVRVRPTPAAPTGSSGRIPVPSQDGRSER
jgi:nucleotide-binding universal stress UspA family protein